MRNKLTLVGSIFIILVYTLAIVFVGYNVLVANVQQLAKNLTVVVLLGSWLVLFLVCLRENKLK